MSISNSKNELGKDGLLWAFQIDGEGKSKVIVPGQASLSENDDGFSWCHFRTDSPETPSLLRELGIDGNVVDVLTTDETRPRMMKLAEGILIILRGVNTNPGQDPDDMVAVRLWFTKSIILSARRSHRRLLSVLDLKQSVENNSGPRSTGEFVTVLTERLADRIGDVVDTIDDKLTEIETHHNERSVIDMRRSLSTLRRETASIRRYLAPQREALDALFRIRGVLTDQDALNLHQQTDRMTRYVEDLDLFRERSMVLQEELQSRIAEEQNARVYVLSIVAAIFLPLSFLTGVFGMNVAGLPGTENPVAFVFLAAGMGVLAVALMGYLYWKKWL